MYARLTPLGSLQHSAKHFCAASKLLYGVRLYEQDPLTLACGQVFHADTQTTQYIINVPYACTIINLEIKILDF